MKPDLDLSGVLSSVNRKKPLQTKDILSLALTAHILQRKPLSAAQSTASILLPSVQLISPTEHEYLKCGVPCVWDGITKRALQMYSPEDSACMQIICLKMILFIESLLGSLEEEGILPSSSPSSSSTPTTMSSSCGMTLFLYSLFGLTKQFLTLPSADISHNSGLLSEALKYILLLPPAMSLNTKRRSEETNPDDERKISERDMALYVKVFGSQLCVVYDAIYHSKLDIMLHLLSQRFFLEDEISLTNVIKTLRSLLMRSCLHVLFTPGLAKRIPMVATLQKYSTKTNILKHFNGVSGERYIVDESEELPEQFSGITHSIFRTNIISGDSFDELQDSLVATCREELSCGDSLSLPTPVVTPSLDISPFPLLSIEHVSEALSRVWNGASWDWVNNKKEQTDGKEGEEEEEEGKEEEEGEEKEETELEEDKEDSITISDAGEGGLRHSYSSLEIDADHFETSDSSSFIGMARTPPFSGKDPDTPEELECERERTLKSYRGTPRTLSPHEGKMSQILVSDFDSDFPSLTSSRIEGDISDIDVTSDAFEASTRVPEFESSESDFESSIHVSQSATLSTTSSHSTQTGDHSDIRVESEFVNLHRADDPEHKLCPHCVSFIVIPIQNKMGVVCVIKDSSKFAFFSQKRKIKKKYTDAIDAKIKEFEGVLGRRMNCVLARAFNEFASINKNIPCLGNFIPSPSSVSPVNIIDSRTRHSITKDEICVNYDFCEDLLKWFHTSETVKALKKEPLSNVYNRHKLIYSQLQQENVCRAVSFITRGFNHFVHLINYMGYRPLKRSIQMKYHGCVWCCCCNRRNGGCSVPLIPSRSSIPLSVSVDCPYIEKGGAVLANLRSIQMKYHGCVWCCCCNRRNGGCSVPLIPSRSSIPLSVSVDCPYIEKGGAVLANLVSPSFKQQWWRIRLQQMIRTCVNMARVAIIEGVSGTMVTKGPFRYVWRILSFNKRNCARDRGGTSPLALLSPSQRGSLKKGGAFHGLSLPNVVKNVALTSTDISTAKSAAIVGSHEFYNALSATLVLNKHRILVEFYGIFHASVSYEDIDFCMSENMKAFVKSAK
ncbi:hypothetical protein ADUPG1_007216 [Aduncisulcus paluster]|uniref:Uncharacterized protein n=1 Tax=Aduncisulcus paluster TaxID=2918883 RepID=A0ABQ5KMT0_9EUKA|nr:hypothetical protein ADUPG1_007216 [Aduncisulcus paluster]